MSQPEYTEDILRHNLRDSENNLDRTTMDSLAEARENALHSKNSMVGNYRGLFSAGLVTAALVVAVFLPLNDRIPNGVSNTNIAMTDENLRLLMEDPEFFLWVSNSSNSVTQ